MAKQADVEFRIRSRDLSKKTIDEVTKELDQLNEKLREQRDAASIASKSIKDLNAQQKLLASASANLSARRGDVEALQRQQAEIAQTVAALNKYRRELAELRATQRRGNFLGDIGKAIKEVGRSVDVASRQLDRQQKSFDKAADRARGYGVEIDDLEGSLRKIDGLQENVNASLKESSAGYDRREKAIKGSVEAQRRQEEATHQQIEAERRLQQELADSIRFEQERDQARRRARVVQSRAGFEEGFAERERREREITAEVQRRAEIERAAVTQQQVLYRELYQERMQREQRLAQAVKTFQAASRNQLRNPETRRAVVEEQRLLGGRRQLGTATQNVSSRTRQLTEEQRRLNNVNRTALGFNQRLRGQILSIAAAYFGVFEAIRLVRTAVTTDIERQGTFMRLSVAAGGDIVQAGKDFDYVREQADRLGQSLTPLAAQYSKFAISAVGAGQSLETTRKVFENFAEVATTLQLSAENVDGIFKALEQSFSKGIVQAEEIRGQLGDRLPGAFTKLAKAIGLTNGEMTKLMENGELTADVLPLMAEFMADEVAGQLPEATRNIRSELGRLQTAFSDFLVTLSRGGLGDAIRELAIETREFFSSNEGKQFAEDIASTFKLAVDAVRGMMSVLGGPSGLISLLKVLIAVQIARWVNQLAAGIAVATRNLATMRTSMVATTAAARTMGRAFSIAFGPIGIAVALAAEALLYFSAQAEDAAEAAAEYADRLNEIKTASGQTLDALIALNEKELEAEKQAYDTARAKRVEAVDRLKNVKAILEEQRAHKGLEALNLLVGVDSAGDTARQLKAIEDEIVDYNTTIAQYNAKVKQTADARTRATRLASEAETKAISAMTAIQEEVNDEGNKAKFKSDDKYYNDLVGRAREAYGEIGDIARSRLKQTTIDQQEALQASIGRLRAERAGIDLSRLDKKDDKADKAAERARRAAEKLAEDRKRIAERTANVLADIEADIANARMEKEIVAIDQIEANYQQRLIIIDKEIEKRRNDLDALRRQAQKLGQPDAVGTVDTALGQLAVLQKEQQVRANTDSILAQMRFKEEELNRLVDQRAAKIDYINALREAGQLTELEAELKSRQAVLEGQDAIFAKAQELRDFLLANQGLLSGVMNVDAVLLQLDALSVKINHGTTASQKFLYTWRDEISTGVADAFGTMAAGLADFIKGTASLSDAFKSAADAFLNFAADFLVNIGKMIIQAIILKAIQNALTPGASGGFWDAALGAVGTAHTGAIVGAPIGSKTRVSPLAFVGAPRYHEGGFPGLRPGEVPIIAQQGEEVLSRVDPRNALNGGAASRAPDLKIINAIDSASVVSEAMNRRDGQQPVVNMIRARRAEIKQILGVA